LSVNSQFRDQLLSICSEDECGMELLEATTKLYADTWGATSVFIGALKDQANDIVVGFAGYRNGLKRPPFEYCSTDQPCKAVYANQILNIPCGVQNDFARKAGSGTESFLGFPINHPDHGTMAHFAAYDSRTDAFTEVDEISVALMQLVISREMAHVLARQKLKAIESVTKELEQWRDAALTDPLTQLFNRRALEEHWFALQQNGGQAEIAIIDIDHFKALNDNYGHDVGDLCLVHIATEMKRHFRNQRAKAYRLGGEEFCILKELTGKSDPLNQDLEGFKDLLALSFRQSKSDLPTFTFSAGMDCTAESSDLYVCLKAADKNLYTAKAQGRNCIVT